MAKKLPRGLTWHNQRERYRIRFRSKHTQPGREYGEWLPPNTTRRQAEEFLGKLREADRMEQLVWPGEMQKSEPQQRWTVGSFATEVYLPHASAHNKPKTVTFKARRIQSLASHFWDTPLDEITPDAVVRYQADKREAGKSCRTINHDTATLSHLLTLAHELGHHPYPSPKFKRLKEVDKKKRKPLSVEEAQAAITQAYQKSQVWGTMALFLLHTGARWGETRELLWESVDLERGVVHFEAEKAKQGRDREVPLRSDLVQALTALPRMGAWVFMRKYRGKVQQLSEDPKVTSRQCAWGDFGPHTFRHTFAHWKLRSGVPIAVVSKWLGHASIQITADMYGHIDGGQHKDEMERGPSVEIRRLRIVGEND